MFVGVNGSGKTTSIGKLIFQLKNKTNAQERKRKSTVKSVNVGKSPIESELKHTNPKIVFAT